MRLPFLAAFALAACSSDPAPIDSGPYVDQHPDSGWTWADAGEDRPAPMDAGADVVDAGAGADVDVWSFEEDPAPDRPTTDVIDAAIRDGGGDGGPTVDVVPGVSSCARETDCGPRFHCFVPSGLCFECTTDDHCAAGSICSNRNVCVPGCTTAHGCGDGRTCCDSVCRDLQSDPLACGSCSARCAGGATCGGGRCSLADAGSDARRD